MTSPAALLTLGLSLTAGVAGLGANVRLWNVYYRDRGEIKVLVAETHLAIEERIGLRLSPHDKVEPVEGELSSTSVYLWPGCLVSEAEARLPHPDEIQVTLSEGRLGSLLWVEHPDRKSSGGCPVALFWADTWSRCCLPASLHRC